METVIPRPWSGCRTMWHSLGLDQWSPLDILTRACKSTPVCSAWRGGTLVWGQSETRSKLKQSSSWQHCPQLPMEKSALFPDVSCPHPLWDKIANTFVEEYCYLRGSLGRVGHVSGAKSHGKIDASKHLWSSIKNKWSVSMTQQSPGSRSSPCHTVLVWGNPLQGWLFWDQGLKDRQPCLCQRS